MTAQPLPSSLSKPVSQPLPPPLSGDQSMLSKAARAEIRKMHGPRPVAFIKQLVSAWSVIFATIWTAVAIDHIAATIAALFIIASRQNVLGLLVHEQSHCLGFKARYGDPVANFFCAYPLMVLTVEGYSQVHLLHHKYFFTHRDPDILRKTGKEWTFPMRPIKLAGIFLKDLIGMNVISLVKGKRLATPIQAFKRPRVLPPWTAPAYYASFALLLTLSGGWDIFLLYWVLPLVTVFQLFVRWGAICEHQYIPGASVTETSPIIIPNWWERLLIPNLNFSLHPYHHFFPGIAFCHLPEVHAIFVREGLVREENVFHGNLAYLKYLVNGTIPLTRNGNGHITTA